MLILSVLYLACGYVVGTPVDPIVRGSENSVDHEDVIFTDEAYFTKMDFELPRCNLHKFNERHQEWPVKLIDILEKKSSTSSVSNFFGNYGKGHASKGIVFNIYNDDTLDTTMALYEILNTIEDEKLMKNFVEWCYLNINEDMLTYVLRSMELHKDVCFNLLPPFISNPYYFYTSETIYRALLLKLKKGDFDSESGTMGQYFKKGDTIYINANYSAWNTGENKCDSEINYFREDIGLNTYYYGLNLLFPHWMDNKNLESFNARFGDLYYYTHQQLIARYLLEKEHLKVNSSTPRSQCQSSYNPHLVYENGIPMPVRPEVTKWNSDEENDWIEKAEIMIKEFVSRGFVILQNKREVLMEGNYVDLITKLVRNSFNEQTVRTTYGLSNMLTLPNSNTLPQSASVLHHPETTLRDPFYWDMVEHSLSYINDYKDILEPYDLSEIDIAATNIEIKEPFELPSVTTYFEDYDVDISKGRLNVDCDSNFKVVARQRRLNHKINDWKFNLISEKDTKVAFRIFMGPHCHSDDMCSEMASRFYQIDAFSYQLHQGHNVIPWSSQKSKKYTYESYDDGNNKCLFNNIYKFPGQLLFPRGTEDGLKLTVLLVVSPNTQNTHDNFQTAYQNLTSIVDSKPIAFPFHKRVILSNPGQSYQFYNLTIYHKTSESDSEN